MGELAKLLGGKGRVAILAGNQNAPNLRRRVEGVKTEAAKHHGIQIIGTFYHAETPQDAAAEVIRVNNAYPDIKGWAMVGGWALFTKTLLTDLDPKKVKLVAVDALPTELPYVEKGLAPVLLAQSSYLWGNVGVTKIIDKLFYKKDVPEIVSMDPVRVTIGDARLVGAPAPAVGLPRRPRGIPEAQVAPRGRSWSQQVDNVATAPLVSFRHVSKRFPGARALEDVSFDVRRGSCHALCGENGAGKSTLGKLLAGIEQPDAGEIAVDGRVVSFEDPRDALAAGIGMVHQELAFCENLSVAENLCLGDLPARALFVSRAEMEKRARAMLAAIEAPIDVRRLVGELTVAEQQMVQIAAAVGSGARVIIFDEPTSSLSQHETEHFYELLDRLRARDVTCVFVSHRMQEIFRLCDTITVLRDGRHVATKPIRRDRRGGAGAAHDRPPAGGVPARRHADGRRRRGAARRASSRARASSPTSASRCTRARWWASPAWSGAGPHRHRARDLRSRSGGARACRGRGHPARPALARGGDARRRRLRPRGSQAPRPGAEHARARERDAADAALARARRLAARRRGARARGRRVRAAARAHARSRRARPPVCRAAISRSWCSRSGWRRAAAC